MLALYHASGPDLAGRKEEWLIRFQQDGFWLLDVVDRLVNKLSATERSKARKAAAPAAIARIAAAKPTLGTIVCHGPTFTDLISADAETTLTFLHRQPIPFPLGNWRKAFSDDVRTALAEAGLRTLL
jgi:hypothetical protein